MRGSVPSSVERRVLCILAALLLAMHPVFARPAREHERALIVSLPGIGARSLVLEPAVLLAPEASFTLTDVHGSMVATIPEPVSTWRGHVRGDEASIVRLTLAPGMMRGYVTIGAQTFVLGSKGWMAAKRAPVDGAVVDRVVPPGAEGDGPLPSQQVGAGVLNCALMPCAQLTAQVVLDADVFFYERAPSTCFARQLAALNEVQGIFEQRAVDVRFQVTQQNCRAGADLGGEGTDVAIYHDAFKRWWDGQGSDRSLVHLFVGYDFAGRTLGRTYTPAVCGRIQPDPLVKGPPEQRCPFGYSLSQAVPDGDGAFTASVFHTTKLLANIWGYAFDGRAREAEGCGPERTGTILCTPIQWNGPNVFSAANEQRIRTHAEEKLGYLARVP